MVIVNPASGKRRGPLALAAIRPILEQGGVTLTVVETTHSGHAREIAQQQDFTDFDLLLPIGGDGTLNEVANGLLSRKDSAEVLERLLLAIVPGGTGNTVAFDLKIYTAEDAAKAVLKALTSRIDVMVLDSPEDDTVQRAPIYALNVVGWALPSKIMTTANRLRVFGCGAQYNLAIYISILRNAQYMTKITYVDRDDRRHEIEKKISLFTVMETIHAGDKTPLSPGAKMDDGLIDMTLIESKGLLSNVKTMDLTKNGMHVKRPAVFQAQCKEVVLKPMDPTRLYGDGSVNVDGELLGFSPLRIKVLPKALRIIVPAEAADPPGAHAQHVLSTLAT